MSGHIDDRLEWAQLRLAAVTVICAAAMFLGGLALKTTRSATNPDGSGQGWADGVKPWVGWAVLGGLAILAVLAIGWWFDQRLVAAVLAALVFAQAGREAAAYRDRLEASIVDHPHYTEQSLALGLRFVPEVATAGAISASLLAVASIARLIGNRRRPVGSLIAR